MSRGRYAYRVRFRREGWAHEQQRTYFTEDAARRLVGKLMGPERPDLAPIVSLRVDRRPVGAWGDLVVVVG